MLFDTMTPEMVKRLTLFPKPMQAAEQIGMFGLERVLDPHLLGASHLDDVIAHERRRAIAEMAPVWEAILTAGRPVMVNARHTVTPDGWNGVRNDVRVYEDRASQEAVAEAMGICFKAGYAVQRPYWARASDKAELLRLADKLGYHVKRKRRTPKRAQER